MRDEINQLLDRVMALRETRCQGCGHRFVSHTSWETRCIADRHTDARCGCKRFVDPSETLYDQATVPDARTVRAEAPVVP